MSEPRKRGLTGIVPIRDGIETDYTPALGVESLLPICDEVIVSDGGSTDGTREFFVEWAAREPKLRVVDWPWPNPVSDNLFLVKWLRWTQEFARYDMTIHLDADEVLDPCSFPAIRQAVKDMVPLWAHRVNLWKDAAHEAPHGTVCSHLVVYLGPTCLGCTSDEYHLNGEEQIRQLARSGTAFRVWHLGFLRKQKPFLLKSRREQMWLCGSWDQRLQHAEDTGEDWIEPCTWKDRPLIEHGLPLPALIVPWLKERGRLV